MRIEVFSDMVCPWCYIGKRRLETALSRVEEPAEIVWRGFQLDPYYVSERPETLHEAHIGRYGVSEAESERRIRTITELAAREGLHYRLDRAIVVNTLDAHRLVHHAATHGKGIEVVEALMRAYAVEGRSIADPETLAELATAAGLPPLEPGAYAERVAADRERAHRYGVTGVPTLVVNESYGLVSPEVADLINVLTSARI
ncbi:MULTISPECIES: DsbA family oxidoreductase [Actinomadura]|uniref:DsbA family protein n=1 Tax=Actinomadura yumaensis TaxID=111807 RepID=A0ABW2CPR1_9ACTN|nr:DsbA family oxidoreductase [Actinomadura sp. J1-007]MWK35241.1 DsbA family oxidoreductase [Actinomadura sp. J1-007]